MEIDILGTKYTIIHKDISDDSKLDEMEGYTDVFKKTIVLGKLEQRDYFKDEQKEKLDLVKKKILRHEIIHAFLFESGLDSNSNRSYAWADNEEMVDWFAIQSPKIFEVYRKLECL